MEFNESLLHYIWKYQLFNHNNLLTTDGKLIHIENIGIINHNAGPDFEYARIRIENTLWVGQVEIHIRESDWILHKHQQDKNYDNTILHVVWEKSKKNIHRNDGTKIPTLVLKNLVQEKLISTYKDLIQNESWIPCANQITKVKDITIESCLSRMAIGRLEQKHEAIFKLLEKTNQDWERVLQISLGRAFGMKVNADVFEDLCYSLDFSILYKNREDRTKIESLIFGTSGLLSLAEDNYCKTLKTEFHYLQKLHNLPNFDTSRWKFLRMRPYNFPTYRLAQFAAMITKNLHWFSTLLSIKSLDELFTIIDKSNLNKYWETHYKFGFETKKHSIKWSNNFKEHLAINCFIPILFAYGTYTCEEKYKERALDWLNALSAENNKITRGFKNLNINCNNATDSQALLYLKNNLCDKKKCLSCIIGLDILKN